MRAEPGRACAGAGMALVVLTGINLVNYLDRFVPSAVKELFKADLRLTDAETSLPFSIFVLVYMIASPVFGALADRWPRKVLIAAGVALWSIATGAAGLASGFGGFLVARALVGVGEAAYGTLGPALLADYHPPAGRNRVMTLFCLAIPIGAALGYGLGAHLGQRFGWRAAFMVCGFPGLLLAALVLLLKEPRSSSERAAIAAPAGWAETLRSLRSNRAYALAVIGNTAVTFGAGGLADWLPTHLVRARGFDTAGAGRAIGLVTVLGGLLGTWAGGVLADRARRHTRQPYFAVSACSMAIGALLTAVVLASARRPIIVGGMFLTHFFLWFFNGPINATLINVTSARHRVRAFAVAILSLHLFGDAISPYLIGLVADVTGRLMLGLALIPFAFAVGALAWAVAWRTLPDNADTAPMLGDAATIGSA